MSNGTFTAYEVLQVSPHASSDVIKAAHRAMSKTAHPDAGGSNHLAIAVNEAAEVLLDPTRRSRYDLELRIGKARQFSPQERIVERIVERIIEVERIVEIYYMICGECGIKNRLNNSEVTEAGKCGSCGMRFYQLPKRNNHPDIRKRDQNMQDSPDMYPYDLTEEVNTKGHSELRASSSRSFVKDIAAALLISMLGLIALAIFLSFK